MLKVKAVFLGNKKKKLIEWAVLPSTFYLHFSSANGSGRDGG